MSENNHRPSDFQDMDKLWRDVVRSMLYGTLENYGIDYIAGIDVIRYGNLLRADSMAFEDFDLGHDLWLNPQRWTRLVRQYLDPSETTQFIERAQSIGLGEGKRGVITSMQTANILRERRKHRWGPCMNSYTYRGLRTEEPTLSMHSRVSYIAYIGGADLALAHVLAREIGRRIKVPVENFQFEWHVGALQLHAFKSIPFLLSEGYADDLDDPQMAKDYPAFRIISRWWQQIVRQAEEGMPLEEIKYGPLRRVSRRYREWVAEDYLPSTPIESLSLEPLYRTR